MKSQYSFQFVTQETILLCIITFVYSTNKCILTFWLSRKFMFKKPVYSFQLVAVATLLYMHILCTDIIKVSRCSSVEFDGS